MDKRIKGLVAGCCSLGIALLVAGPSWSAVAEKTALPAAATLEELDQIVINGKRIEQLILESEQRLFERYNTLNGNNDFDVDCSAKWNDDKSTGYGTTQYKSGCVPLFFANAMAGERTIPLGGTTCRSSTDTNGFFMRTPTGWGSLANSSLSSRSGGNPVVITPPFIGCNSSSTIASPRAHLMWLDRRAAFKANLGEVIRTDPQLQALAGEFNSLMRENDDALKIAAAARKQQLELQRSAQKCPAPTSPRVAPKACKTS
jgi:hypothetical protein